MTIRQGDALTVLATLPSGSVHCVVTSPAYWGLRKYRAGPQEMGSEATPDCGRAGLMSLRAGLTKEELAYVARRLGLLTEEPHGE